MKTAYYQYPSGQVTTSSPEFPPHDAERIPATQGRELHREQTRKELRELLPPGTTVFSILRSVSQSGMSRRISFMIFRDNQPYHLDFSVGIALDRTRPDKGEGLKIDGGGMDMGFHVVHSLSYALHGTGSPRDTSEQTAARGDTRPGYTLNHRWL